MNEDRLLQRLDDMTTDIKQFVAATVSQTEQRLNERIDAVEQRIDSVEKGLGGVERRLDGLQEEMVHGFAGVADALEVYEKETDTRLTLLEQNAA